MGTSVIITMGSLAVGGMVVEKLLMACGKSDAANLVNIGAFSLLGTTAIGTVIKLLASCKQLF